MLSEILNGNGMRHDFNDYVAFMAVAQECSFYGLLSAWDFGHAYTRYVVTMLSAWHGTRVRTKAGLSETVFIA
jgi:hypothetical protein